MLIASGSKPTINSIREKIGRGSPTTISKFFKQWKDEEKPSIESDSEILKLNPEPESVKKGADTINEVIPSDKETSLSKIIKNNPKIFEDPTVQGLISSSESFSNDILMSMSDEWNVILNERNTEIKVKKLYAALTKEQTRRQTAEKVAKEAKVYAEVIQEQTIQRISDLRYSLESQITFLSGQISQLKRESELQLGYYRDQLEKANSAIISLKQ
jgi:hypothetical protein